MIRQFIVTFDVPDGVTPQDAIDYITEAVCAWRGQLNPNNPMFNLDSDHVRVEYHGKTKATASDLITYAAGYCIGDSYGMFAGPSPNIDDVLTHEPDEDETRDAYVLRFNPKGAQGEFLRTHKWDRREGKWKRLR